MMKYYLGYPIQKTIDVIQKRKGFTKIYYVNGMTTLKDIKGELTWQSIGKSGALDPNETIQKVELGTNVTSIGEWSLCSCQELTTIVIPTTVTIIRKGAFNECSKLSEIDLPTSIEEIADYAFCYCTALNSINIPKSVITIGKCAFYECTALKTAYIGKAVSSISEDSFHNCSSLTTLTVDSENVTYDSRDNCNAIINTQSNELIYGCKTTIIPDSVTSIGDQSFYCCTTLTAINIPDSVISIGERAFYNCSITSLSLGNSVTVIKEYAFALCKRLSSVNISNSVMSIDNGVFDSCEALTTIIIPNSVTSIGDYVFSACTALNSITIGNSIKTIGNMTFANCQNLQYISCLATTAPTVMSKTFGNPSYAYTYTGYNTHSTGTNTLYIPYTGTGYDTTYWADPLQNSSKCGFHIEYMS